MIEAVLFDKDGTLFDFQASWGSWARRLLCELAQGDQILLHRLAKSLRFDLKSAEFHPDSFVIAGTPDEVAKALADEMPGETVDGLLNRINIEASEVQMIEAAPLVLLLLDLQARGLKLGVVTNDAEAPARAHLREAGILHAFDVVFGFDSGHGEKPDPDPLLAAARILGVDPRKALMVGDSTHDLVAGRAAGMSTLGVLTGPASRADLAPFADDVLPHVGHLPGWLDQRSH